MNDLELIYVSVMLLLECGSDYQVKYNYEYDELIISRKRYNHNSACEMFENYCFHYMDILPYTFY